MVNDGGLQVTLEEPTQHFELAIGVSTEAPCQHQSTSAPKQENVGREQQQEIEDLLSPKSRCAIRRFDRTLPQHEKVQLQKEETERRDRAHEAISQQQSKPRSDRTGVSCLLPSSLDLNDAARLCAQAVKREMDRLPQSEVELRMVKRRMPKNRTDALLKSGVPFDEAVRTVARWVLEKWVKVLRRHLRSGQMVRALTDVVHGGTSASSIPKSMSETALSGGLHGPLQLRPNPTPAACTPLGAALRQLLPEGGRGRCDFVEDILAALQLEDQYVPTSAMHVLRPNTALRSQLDCKQRHEDDLDKRVRPDCMKKMDALAAGRLSKQGGARRGALGVASSFRLSGDIAGGWATFSQGNSMRVTMDSIHNVLPQRTDHCAAKLPGPGTYKRPGSTMQFCRVGQYPSVGKLRTIGDAVMGTATERFQ